jgi:hypothetical protein
MLHPDEIVRLEAERDILLVKLWVEALKLQLDLDEKTYDPNQPRVPKGNPDGGQWTDGHDDSKPIDGRMLAQAVTPPRIEALCLDQLRRDMATCGRLSRGRQAACIAQANQRYGACLAQRDIPPLPFGRGYE